MNRPTPPLSVLDLAPITEGGNAATALANSRDLAQHAEALGYRRYWLAEHHNMDGLACSATAVLVGHIAGATRTIRVGAGGVMLPNHAPLVVAEAYGTLATLYPGRIDLGLGRAPGTDRLTAQALRRNLAGADDENFAQDVLELQSYLAPASADQRVRAIPGSGTEVPIWILGSSTYGAQLAAYLGLPYAFASHFAPEQMLAALDVYRRGFRPSPACARPYAMVGVNAFIADSDDEAAWLATTAQQRFLGMQRGQRGALPPPISPAAMDALWQPHEKAAVQRMLSASLIGAPDTARRQLAELLDRTAADELIVAGLVFDHAARRRSYQRLAELAGLAL